MVEIFFKNSMRQTCCLPQFQTRCSATVSKCRRKPWLLNEMHPRSGPRDSNTQRIPSSTPNSLLVDARILCIANGVSYVTLVLQQMQNGTKQAAGQLQPKMYEQLRRLAAARMTNEWPDHMQQASSLSHHACRCIFPIQLAQQ